MPFNPGSVLTNKSPFPKMVISGNLTRIITRTRRRITVTKKKKKNVKFQKPNVPLENAKTGAKTETPVEVKPIGDALSHGTFLGVVYANNLAASEISKENPQFPVGSIIVREKLAGGSSTPEVIIAMVKREKDFSPKTGDWEFFVFDGKDLKLNSRETAGSCATCHAKAEKTDWVFRDYLNK